MIIARKKIKKCEREIRVRRKEGKRMSGQGSDRARDKQQGRERERERERKKNSNRKRKEEGRRKIERKREG